MTVTTVGAALAQLPAEPRANPPAPARPPATAGQNPSTPPEEIAPPAAGTNNSGAGTAGALGTSHTGVLRPPTSVDPGMRVQPPASQHFPTPVIPPPGTRGNQPNVVPK